MLKPDLVERLHVIAKSSIANDLFALLDDGIGMHLATLMVSKDSVDMHKAQGAAGALSDLKNFLLSLKNSEPARPDADTGSDNPSNQE